MSRLNEMKEKLKFGEHIAEETWSRFWNGMNLAEKVSLTGWAATAPFSPNLAIGLSLPYVASSFNRLIQMRPEMTIHFKEGLEEIWEKRKKEKLKDVK